MDSKSEILTQIVKEKPWFIRLIAGRKRRSTGFFSPVDADDAEDIFAESLSILFQKYIAVGKVETHLQARKLLSSITRFQWYKFVNKVLDERWLASRSIDEQGNILDPNGKLSYYPSAVNARVRYRAVRETRLSKERQRYHSDPEYQKKIVERNRAIRIRLRQDPLKRKETAEKKKAYRKQWLATRTPEQLEEYRAKQRALNMKKKLRKEVQQEL